jgi:hypothetical protein
VVRGTVAPGQRDRFVELFREKLVPQVVARPGFKQISFTTMEGSDEVLAFLLFESREDALADEAAFKQRAAVVAELLAGPPESTVREVVIHEAAGD